MNISKKSVNTRRIATGDGLVCENTECRCPLEQPYSGIELEIVWKNGKTGTDRRLFCVDCRDIIECGEQVTVGRTRWCSASGVGRRQERRGGNGPD